MPALHATPLATESFRSRPLSKARDAPPAHLRAVKQKRPAPVVIPRSFDVDLLDEVEYGETLCVVEGFLLDPDDVCPPSTDAWERMTVDQQEFVDSWLSQGLKRREDGVSQNKLHYWVVFFLALTLHAHFSRRGIEAIVATDIRLRLTKKYLRSKKDEVVAPDVFVFWGHVEMDEEEWRVENKDMLPPICFEVHSHGARSKDVIRNVKRYARYGIEEYFVYESEGAVLTGYRLDSARGVYKKLACDNAGRVHSEVLGLDFGAVANRVDVFDENGRIPTSAEGEEALRELARLWKERAEAEARRAEAEALRRRAAERREKIAAKRAATEATQRKAAEERAATEALQRQVAAERAATEATQRKAAEERAATEATQRKAAELLAKTEAERAATLEQKLAEMQAAFEATEAAPTRGAAN